MAHELDTCALKLNRARDKLDALHTAADAFRADEPYRLSKKTDSEGEGRYLWTWSAEVLRKPPAEWSVDAGEILYLTHSALDNLAWRLAQRHPDPEARPKNLTFPIFKTEREFWRKNRRTGDYTLWSGARKLLAMPEDARDLVLEVQPYKCGDLAPNHPLWLLHELSNEDKHKSVHLVWANVAQKRLEIRKSEHAQFVSFDVSSEPFEESADIGWVRFRRLNLPGIDPNPEIDFDAQFAIEEAFAGPGAAAGRPLYDTLADILEYVVNDVFVNRFGPYFGL